MSGASTNREAFNKLTSSAFSPDCPFDGIIVDSLSRLSRDLGDTDRVIKRLKFRGIRLIAVADGFDSAEKTSKILAATKGMVNEIFLDDLRETTKRGMDGQFLKGYSTGGRTYGYRSIKVKDPVRMDAHGEAVVIGYQWQVYDPEAAVVRRIFDRFINGESEKSIAHAMNKERIGGKTWSGNAIYYLLLNPRYRGEVIFNRFEWYKNPDTGKRTYRLRPQNQWEKRQDESLRIVDETTWDLSQERFANRKRVSHTRRAKRVYLLSGLLTCTQCSGSFTLRTSDTYSCSNHVERGTCDNSMGIKRISIETHVLRTVKGSLYNWRDELVQAVTEEVLRHQDPSDLNRNGIDEAKRKAEKLLQTVQEGNLTGRAREELLRKYQEAWNEVERIERNQRLRTQKVRRSYDQSLVTEFIDELDHGAIDYDPEGGREFLACVLRKVEITDIGPEIHECGLCGTKLAKVTPQHAHVHGLDMGGLYRTDPGAGFTRRARVGIYPDPEGVLKTTEVYDAMVAGARIEPTTFR
jgi:DNA invertase Pin-like site-specific DNA recombinase